MMRATVAAPPELPMSPRPDLGPKPPLGYAGSRLDRAAERRLDAAALADSKGARTYVIGGEWVVSRKDGENLAPLFTPSEARAFGAITETVFLGLLDGAPRYGAAIAPAAVEPLKTRPDLVVLDLRSIAIRGLVEPQHLPPLAEAKALLGWHARHRFCPNCGQPTQPVEGGWRRDCPACKTQHFPRTDPVVIMLAVAGERCLLGRSGRFAANSWSCLAGFVEPGETIEEAVRREVHEEAGIACGRVKYLASQPWPFPSSLMIGCHAQALSEDLVVDRNELEDARWFDRHEAAAMLARRHPRELVTPPPVAIAYHIIRGWVEDGVDFG
jgi:NAD+ diphosphatase